MGLMRKSRRIDFRCGDYGLVCDGCVHIMGIVNATPDSFSDGGKYAHVEQAVEQGVKLAREGAAILDVGGESTRPGHVPVSAEEELRRVVPVVRELSKVVSVPISVDTSKGVVAEACLAAGASIINDVSGYENDFEGMVAAQRKYGAGAILMHWRQDLGQVPDADEACRLIGEYLVGRVHLAEGATGLDGAHFMVDPGIGFGKSLEQNLGIIRHTGDFRDTGYPVLLGPSRKSFIGKVLGREEPLEREWGTAGAVAVGAWLGADVVRVHDVKAMADVVAVANAIAERW